MSGRVKLGKCQGCGKVHQVPAEVNVSQTASPCCGDRMRLLTIPKREQGK